MENRPNLGERRTVRIVHRSRRQFMSDAPPFIVPGFEWDPMYAHTLIRLVEIVFSGQIVIKRDLRVPHDLM